MWTNESLNDLVKEKLAGYLFVAVSNREPYIHYFSGKNIKCQVPASGLTAAVDPVMRASRGIWVAHGSGDADREVVDDQSRVMVPPEAPLYTLKRVWLTKEDEDGYYHGFANEALWPLCHIVYNRPIFRESDWNTYKKVNEDFARSILEEIGNRKAFVFIHDYHLALLSQAIKRLSPESITAQFWHIPWPNPEVFRICPWREDILRGMLGNDLMGFHIQYHCNNFLDTVDQILESRIDRATHQVFQGGKSTSVRPFPISVDFDLINRQAQKEEVDREIDRLKSVLGLDDELIGIGMDRLDYTKGIPDRFRAISYLLERYPQFRRKLVFIQAGVPSRIQIPAYRSLREEIDNLKEEINWRYTVGRWKPIITLENESQLTLMAMRRMAHFCIVSSLHDGMNLVAKEFVASRFDEDGVLILSRFAGAARELLDAVQINPYATDHFAEAIREALEMPKEERQKRMRRMRSIVSENNIYKWAAGMITDLVNLRS